MELEMRLWLLDIYDVRKMNHQFFNCSGNRWQLSHPRDEANY